MQPKLMVGNDNLPMMNTIIPRGSPYFCKKPGSGLIIVFTALKITTVYGIARREDMYKSRKTLKIQSKLTNCWGYVPEELLHCPWQRLWWSLCGEEWLRGGILHQRKYQQLRTCQEPHGCSSSTFHVPMCTKVTNEYKVMSIGHSKRRHQISQHTSSSSKSISSSSKSPMRK